jgi:choline kinase
MSTAVILAAGISKRMGDFFDFEPKSLIEIDGESLLRRNIRLLRASGIEDIYVVVGYRQQSIRNHLNGILPDSKIILNDEYEKYGSMWSLNCAFKIVNSDLIVFDADIFVSISMVKNIINRKNTSIIVTPHSNSGDESLPKFKKGRLVNFSKEMESDFSFPEYIGISFFTKECLELMNSKNVEDSLELSYEAALGKSSMTHSFDIDFIYHPTSKWSDLDQPEDLERIMNLAKAERIVFPI